MILSPHIRRHLFTVILLCLQLLPLTGCQQSDNDFDLLYRMSVTETRHADDEIVVEADYKLSGPANMIVYVGDGAYFGGKRDSGTLVIRAQVIDTPQDSFPNTTGTQTIRMTYGWSDGKPTYTMVYPPQVAPNLDDCLRVVEQSGTYGFYDEVVIGQCTDHDGEKLIKVKVTEDK